MAMILAIAHAFGVLTGTVVALAGLLAGVRVALALSTTVLRALRLFGPRERLASPVEAWLARYALHVGLALDLLASAATGGDHRETISSRVGRAQRDGRWLGKLAPIIDTGAFAVSWLMTFGRNPEREHCRAAIDPRFDHP